jgi:hypothetical protein
MDRLGTPEAFAAMLVTEIKMHHGRATGAALEDDIARSRTMFLQRFPAAEAVFDSAVARILRR